MKSNYVCAGFETLATILENFINNKSKRYDGHFTQEQISDFFSKTCNKFLHSFGQSFSGKKKFHKHVEGEANLFRICRDMGFFDESEFIVDSGGFQASVGRLKKDETQLLIDLYHQFLVDHVDVYDRAFVLDLPPGPGCELFDNFNQIYDKNLETYSMAANLPQEVRDKMIYIHHFRTPKLWDIYTKIMRDNDLFDKFQHHGTGGIVANMASDTQIPCIIYVIPMIPLINEALKHGRNFLNFHILGGANFRDILFYELFRIHLLNTHGIEVEISYDSSGLFKGLMVGRYISVIDDGIVRKLDLRSPKLNLRFLGSEKRVDRYKRVFTSLSGKFGFKDIRDTDVYNPDTGTFYDEIRVYSMLHMLNQFAEIQTLLREEAQDIYPIYQSGDIESFIREVQRITQNLNAGKISRKQKAKSVSIVKSLEMLSNLDESYCKYIVDKVLSKDEFTDLEYKRVLTL